MYQKIWERARENRGKQWKSGRFFDIININYIFCRNFEKRGTHMGEKYYKPVIGETEHLLQSKENPNRVRGLSRDENNDNPRIPEWEEFELPSGEDRLREMAFEQEQGRISETADLLELLKLGASVMESISEYLDENPEIIQKAMEGFRVAKQKCSDLKAKIILQYRAKKVLGSDKKSCTTVQCNSTKSNKKNSSRHKNMSVEEAREQATQMVFYYVEFKKRFNRLVSADIIDVEKLDLSQTITALEAIIAEYPALMDKRTQANILSVLGSNLDEVENRRIRKTLHI